MHRAILEACLPCLLWLAAALAGAWLILRISGARAAPARLRELHRCEQGGVQTISFVLTLPVFMMLVLFIVQISQLMIAVTVVHYAAFAAARAASVWIPAEMPGAVEPANQLFPGAIDPGVEHPEWATFPINYSGGAGFPSWKCRKIWSAAVIACMPISPSHQYLTDMALKQSETRLVTTTVDLYQKLVPRTSRNPQIPLRIRNKAAYASEHTWIRISGKTFHASSAESHVTYNPHDRTESPGDPYSPEYAFPSQWQFRPNEIGWQDPITVQVSYRFALLPGPGRFLSPAQFLSTPLTPADGTRDNVSRHIHVWDREMHPGYRESVYFTMLSATATMTNEGLKSIIPRYEAAEPQR